MVVMKFGGSCLTDGEQFMNAAELVKNYPDKKSIVVVSAVYKITDKLLDTGQLAFEKKTKEVEKNLNEIHDKHQEIINYIAEEPIEKERLTKENDNHLEELRQIYKGVFLIT